MSLAFVLGIHRWPVTSPHIGPVTRKMFPFDDVFMQRLWLVCCLYCYKQSSQLSHWSQVMHICIIKGMPLAYWSKHYSRLNAEHPVDGKSTLVRVFNGLVSSRSSTPYDITERLWFKVAVLSFVWSLVSAFGSFQLTCVFEVILRPLELIDCLINTKNIPL